MQKTDVIIIGAGLAGLSAGYELIEKGKKVLLLEARGIIGGRTSSWIDDGMEVESGLHRFLGFYTALPELLKNVGIDLDKMLFWEDEIEIRLPNGGPEAVIGLSPLHKPFKTLSGFLGNLDFLDVKDKLTLGAFFTAALKDYATNPEKLDQQTVLQYAKKHNVTDNAIKHLLIPLTSGIFFLPPEKYSMYALTGFVGPYLPSLLKMRVGAFMGGMTEVMCKPIARYIEEHGGKIKVNEPVENLIVKDKKVIGVKTKNKKYYADHVLLSSSLQPAQEIIKKSLPKEKWFNDMLKLSSMPAVTIQFELKKRSMKVDRTTFGPLTSWASFAEQSKTTFPNTKGRLSVILTPPEKFLKINDKEILNIAIEDGKKLGIELKGIIKDFRTTKIPDDFYSLSPGNEKLRPTQKTPIKGLTLAGDYTKQPYLATMEGAVVSGKLATECIITM